MSANPQLGAYGAEVSQYSWASLRVLDTSQCNVTEADCCCAMPILTFLVVRNNPLSELEKLVRHWHAPTRKLLDLREVDNLPESLLDGLSYNAQKLRSNPRDSVDNVVVF